MLKSMTGYGEAAVRNECFVFGVEIRSVNNKFLKITTKIPEEISYLQNELEELIRKTVQRGSVSLTVRFEPASNVDLFEVDEGVIKKYLRTLHALKGELQTGEEIFIKDVLVLPGVVRSETALPFAKEKLVPVAREATAKALAQVVAMRQREGVALEAEFHAYSKALGSSLAEVRKMHPAALKEHHARLKERVNQLLSGTELSLSSEDLLREVAVLAERADIAEEVVRMESHLGQLGETLREEHPSGRKLEFILQEMVRELNTMGSKATDSMLQRFIIEMKAELSRLREQVQNVE